MPNGTHAAVSEAARLGEIGFPEFTAKLITDTFDALVATNLRQTQAYIELVKQVSKPLTDFINDTKDDIGGDQILQFLARMLPDPKSATGTKIVEGSTVKLLKEEAEALNTALKVEGVQEGNFVNADENIINENKFKEILKAVAIRIAADKYTLLKEMVKMGILRLVVEHGVIETRITFTTYGSTFYEKNTSAFHRDDFQFRAKAKTGWMISKWVSASASTSYSSLNVSTARETNRDISGSHVQIYGSVRIDFKTDYQPMTV